jgi:hypothetical protein
MASEKWSLQGRKLSICNCDYGCPCEFNARPTNGDCEGLDVGVIDQGHFGSVLLDGVRFASVYRWPGPLHEGKGEAQTILDESASVEQRNALLEIFSGKHSAPGTIFPILGAVIEKEHETLVRPIAFEVDIPGGRAKGAIADLLNAAVEPIRNPVTGAEHRVVIDLPQGWEFRRAEVVAGTAKSDAGIKLDLSGKHAFVCEFAYGPNGLL